MVHLRRAGKEHVEVLTGLRLALFREMGLLADREDPGPLGGAIREYLARALPAGEFVAFVAETQGEVVACSGVVFYTRPPSPGNLSGREAYVLNMFTRPEWRGQGIATRLLEETLALARTRGGGHVWLHATVAGRPIYERFGFRPKTTEMERQL